MKKERTIIGEIHYLTYTIRVMSDGKLLQSTGRGTWRNFRKCKDPKSAPAVYASRVARLLEIKRKCPAYAEFLTALHSLVPLTKRSFLCYLFRDQAGGTPDDTQFDRIERELLRCKGRRVTAESVEYLYPLWLTRQIERNTDLDMGKLLDPFPVEPETK